MPVQILIVILYFVITVLLGLLSRKKAKTSTAFHGAGLGVLMCVCASTGEWLGGTSTTGVSEYGFTYGISGSWYTIANGIGVMFLAILFAKLYRSLETVTVPGIIGKFIGARARTVSSILLTFVMLAVGISQMIAAGSLGVSLLGIDYTTGVIGFAVVFIAYTLTGGMQAVIYTNIMHLVVMYGGILLATVLSLGKVGGFAQVTNNLPSSYFSMTAIGFPKISSWVIASLLGACTAQAGIQPILAAKDVGVAKRASVITALVVAPFGIGTAFLGMIAKVMSDKGLLLDIAGNVVADGKLALPTLMMQLPPFAGGLVLASILAAILSTVSPIILASGTMLTKDIYQSVLFPNASDKQVLFVSRLTTAVSGVICALFAIIISKANIKVLDIVYFAYSLRGALFVMVLLAIYWKRLSQKGAIYGMVATIIVSFSWVIYNSVYGQFPIHPAFSETYAAVITSFVFTVAFSRIFPKENIKAEI